jgi:OOP family OmpA-OmpF porin
LANLKEMSRNTKLLYGGNNEILNSTLQQLKFLRVLFGIFCQQQIKKGPGLSPYISAGVGFTFLHIKRNYSNYNAAWFAEESALSAGLSADLAHSLPKGFLVFPVGFGLRYSLTENVSLNAESSYRLNSTDYLDGFSQAANPAKKDHYFSNAVGLIYSFGKKNRLKCPRIRY